MIYHITTPDAWKSAQGEGAFSDPSLQREGFIHFSKASQIIAVANAVYKGQTNLILLCVDEYKLANELKWEAPAQPEEGDPVPVQEGDLFPHLYGTLNLDAVVHTVNFPANADGTFALPDGVE